MENTHSSKSKPFLITIPISEQRVKDLLCCGMEGGINYWGGITGYVGESEVEFKHLDYPFIDGHGVLLAVEEEPKSYLLDRQALERGVALLPTHIAARVAEEQEDADDGDTFIQLCIFGEVVYG